MNQKFFAANISDLRRITSVNFLFRGPSKNPAASFAISLATDTRCRKEA